MADKIIKQGTVLYKHSCPMCGCVYVADEHNAANATRKYWKVTSDGDLPDYHSRHIKCPSCGDLTRIDLSNPSRLTLDEINELQQ